MSKDCSFDSHISSLSRKCKNLAGWILRSFVSRDKLTMLTLFKSLVISRLDYASQLWSPHKISQITLIEKVQRSFTKHITGMRDLSYHERLQALRLYSLQRRRERYCIILIWKIIESKAQNLSDPILCNFLIVEVNHVSSPMLTRVDREHSHTIASVGELFAYLIPYQNLFVTPQIVLFVASNKDLIATCCILFNHDCDLFYG